jgi:hypothetical protein
MSSNVVNQVSYLKTSRNFPQEPRQLTVEMNKSYVDIANAVNSRVIGIFPTTRPAITGEEWFIIANRKQQGLRRVYTFSTIPATIPHGLIFADIERFVRIYGVFTDGTFWYTLPWVSVVGATNQVQIYLDLVNINIIGGGGGTQPTATKGTVVLEWLSQP